MKIATKNASYLPDTFVKHKRFAVLFFLLRKLTNRELKHQTFLIHERHGWPRRTESGTQFAREIQIFKQNSVKPSRTSTEKFCWKRLSKICVRFCFFLPKKTWFQTKNFYLCMTNTLRRTQNLNLWFQPENTRFEVRDRSSRTSWHAQWLSFCKNTSGWRPWYQERRRVWMTKIKLSW